MITLFVGTTSAIEFAELQDDDNLISSPSIDVNTSDINPGNATLDIGTSVETYNETVDSDTTTFDVDIGSSDYGRYDVEVYDTNDSSNNDIVTNVAFDGDEPSNSFDNPGDGDVISGDNPDIEASFSDDVSGLKNASIWFEGEQDNQTDIGGDSSVDLEIEDGDYDALDDGSHKVNYEAFDRAGNSVNSSWTFTVDTSYDGPEEFSFDPSPGVIDVDEDDREIDITVDEDYEDDTDIDVECRVDGDEEDSTSIDADGSDGDEFTCDIPDDFDAQMFDLELYLEDQAGNSYTHNSEEFGFDDYSPSVDNVALVEDVDNFAEDFDVEYTVSDDVSDIDTVEYYIGDDPGEGEVDSSQQLSEASGEFTLDTSDLGEGEHTLYLRAKDEFDKWSSTDSFEFNFYPNEVPELEMTLNNDNLEIQQGQTKTVEVTLDNTGLLIVPSGDLQVSKMAENVSYGDIKPDDSETYSVDLSPEDELGNHTVDIEASNVDASASIDLLVAADEDEQQSINESFQSYKEEFEDLKSDVEDLRPSLSSDRKERLNQDYEVVESSIQDAEEALEEGNYYRVNEIIDGLGSDISQAQDTFEEVEEEHSQAMRNRYLILGGFVVLALVASGVGFVAYSDEYEFDVSIPEIGGGASDSDSVSDEKDEERSAIERIKDRVSDMRGSDEGDEGPEYEFK